MENTNQRTGTGDDSMNPVTRALLTLGAVGGPLFVVVAVIEVAARPGFDVTRHQLSMTANGDLGWVQATNFLLTGMLILAGAIGMRRALRGSRAGTWGPLLIAAFGLSTVLVTFFTADPARGFPPGTPTSGTVISSHGLIHLAIATIGFVALIAACFVLARRFADTRERGWQLYSLATGVVFLLVFAANVGTGSAVAAINVAFLVFALHSYAWPSVLSWKLSKAHA
jgi:hypothetical membrane protein